MIRRPPRSTRVRSSAASDVYKRQVMVVIVGIMALGLNLFDRSNKTGSAHSMALLLTEKIEQEVRFADTVTVLAALPATPAAGTYYLYFNNDNTNPANTGLR